jgi:hypothetical protein
VNDRLAEALPDTEKVLVTGGHLINPAHPAVLDFLGRRNPHAARKRGIDTSGAPNPFRTGIQA